MDDTHHPKRSRFFNFLRLLTLLLLCVAGFAGYTRFSAWQHTANQQMSNDVFEVRLHNVENTIPLHEKRLQDLEDKVAKLAASPAPASPSAPAANAAPSNDDARIAALEKQIATLKAAPASASPEANADVYDAIKLLSAFHRLSDKVIGGKPFTAELSAFEEVDTDEIKAEPIATLTPYAESGIPTFAILLSSFDNALDQLNAAQAIPPADASWWDRFVYNIEHLVSIRKVDAAATEKSVDAIVGRAQAHLEREEIEAAVTEIKTLPEDARGNFTVWLEDAQIATEMPSLVDQIEEQVMQKAFHTEATPTAKGQK